MKKTAISLISLLLITSYFSNIEAQISAHQLQLNEYITKNSIPESINNMSRGGLPNPNEQYLFDEFLEGYILTIDSLKLLSDKLNYNKLLDEIQYINGEDTLTFANPKKVAEVNINDKIFLRYPSSVYNLPASIVQLLYNGKYSLYKVEKTVFVEEVPSGAYQEREPAHYSHENWYYIYNNEFSPVKSKKDVYNLFPKQKNELKAFFKENKISFKSDFDMLSLIEYLNSSAN